MEFQVIAAWEQSVESQIDEHEVIRAGLKMLSNLAEHCAAQSKTVNPNDPSATELIRNEAKNLRWTLFYFHDGLKSHFERDETAILPRAGQIDREILFREHAAIKKQVEEAVVLANRLTEGKLTIDELSAGAVEIERMVGTIKGLIEAHTRWEDNLMRLTSGAPEESGEPVI
jgi:hypothetical protein